MGQMRVTSCRGSRSHKMGDRRVDQTNAGPEQRVGRQQQRQRGRIDSRVNTRQLPAKATAASRSGVRVPRGAANKRPIAAPVRLRSVQALVKIPVPAV